MTHPYIGRPPYFERMDAAQVSRSMREHAERLKRRTDENGRPKPQSASMLHDIITRKLKPNGAE
jgi:hypothetical protein